MILTHPRGLVYTAHSWHVGLELMKSTLKLCSQREHAATTGWEGLPTDGNGGRGRQLNPQNGPEGPFSELTENVSSKAARSLSLDTYLARAKAWEHVGGCACTYNSRCQKSFWSL